MPCTAQGITPDPSAQVNAGEKARSTGEFAARASGGKWSDGGAGNDGERGAERVEQHREPARPRGVDGRDDGGGTQLLGPGHGRVAVLHLEVRAPFAGRSASQVLGRELHDVAVHGPLAAAGGSGGGVGDSRSRAHGQIPGVPRQDGAVEVLRRRRVGGAELDPADAAGPVDQFQAVRVPGFPHGELGARRLGEAGRPPGGEDLRRRDADRAACLLHGPGGGVGVHGAEVRRPRGGRALLGRRADGAHCSAVLLQEAAPGFRPCRPEPPAEHALVRRRRPRRCRVFPGRAGSARPEPVRRSASGAPVACVVPPGDGSPGSSGPGWQQARPGRSAQRGVRNSGRRAQGSGPGPQSDRAVADPTRSRSVHHSHLAASWFVHRQSRLAHDQHRWAEYPYLPALAAPLRSSHATQS